MAITPLGAWVMRCATVYAAVPYVAGPCSSMVEDAPCQAGMTFDTLVETFC